MAAIKYLLVFTDSVHLCPLCWSQITHTLHPIAHQDFRLAELESVAKILNIDLRFCDATPDVAVRLVH
jgi:hypothetical protein